MFRYPSVPFISARLHQMWSEVDKMTEPSHRGWHLCPLAPCPLGGCWVSQRGYRDATKRWECQIWYLNINIIYIYIYLWYSQQYWYLSTILWIYFYDILHIKHTGTPKIILIHRGWSVPWFTGWSFVSYPHVMWLVSRQWSCRCAHSYSRGWFQCPN